MKSWSLAIFACGLWSCSKEAPEPVLEKPVTEVVALADAAASSASSALAEVASATDAGATPAGPDAEGFSKLSLVDRVPVCLFPSHKEHEKNPVFAKVKKQTLLADSKVVVGAFAPWCVNEKCDDVPTLQCWIDQEGNTLTVNTRYTAKRKKGTHCSEPCRPVAAGCPSEDLPKGSYVLKYGEKTLEFKVPGAVRAPCIPAESFEDVL